MGNLINGPFETEREARDAAHEVVRPEPGWSILQKSQNLFVLEQACEAAGRRRAAPPSFADCAGPRSAPGASA